jgi:hypothetical protein
MAALLVALLWLLFQIVGHTSSAATSTPLPTHLTVTGTVLPLTIDGHAVRMRPGPIELRQGQVVRFAPRAGAMRIARLECRGDVHPIRGRVWRVPDLPEGEYALEGATFGLLVRARGHSAPCPGP